MTQDLNTPCGIYLDNNATTRIAPEVLDVMARHGATSFANPGSRHWAGRKARQALDEARESLAAILGAHPDEVVFTSGGTESNNMAVFGFAQGPPAIVAHTFAEHPSVAEPCHVLRDRGWRLHELAVDDDGLLRPDQYRALPWSELRLVSVILAHNETGVIQDVAPLAALCREQGVPFHTDAVQAVGKIPINFHRLGASSMSLGAHKFHGPRGVGALLVGRDCRLSPTAWGGHQETGRRPGTEAVPLIMGMVRALELFDAERDARRTRLANLRDILQEGLLESCAGAVVNGARAHRLPNTLNIAFPGVDGEALLVSLDLEGVACSLGSTCASGAAEPAAALVAMRLPAEILKSSIRLSLAADTTRAEIDSALSLISRVVRRLRGQG